jgi:putative intracellular protease/amidase
MQIAILLFDGLTVLDAVGPYEVLSRIPEAEVVLVGERTGLVTSQAGSLRLNADATLAEVPDPHIVVVPGGPGQASQMSAGPVHDWLRAADQQTTWTTAVCTGTLILAAAGLLTGRRATTHWLALDELAGLGAIAEQSRVVTDGKYLTAAGVSAGIDMALTLAGLVAGDDRAQAIQLGIEYDPQPPYAAGSPLTAPAGIVAELRSGSRFAAAHRPGHTPGE